MLDELLVFSAGTVTVERYRDESLEPYVGLFRGALGDQFVFMNDNADHTQLYLLTIILKKWVFTAWCGQRGLQNSIPLSMSVMLLEEVLQVNNPSKDPTGVNIGVSEERELLPQSLINSIINIMRARCDAVQGGHTSY